MTMKKVVGVHQIITQSGRIIDFTNVEPDQISILDLARGLANVCRYSGQVKQFYSVAEHCLLVARYAPLHLKPYALLHDASEAYIGDVPRPVKLLCPEYKDVENRVEAAIFRKFGVVTPTAEEKAIIKRLDNAALLTEAADLKVGDIKQWLDVPGRALPDRPRCLTPAEAEVAWLDAAKLLGLFDTTPMWEKL